MVHLFREGVLILTNNLFTVNYTTTLQIIAATLNTQLLSMAIIN